MSQKKFVHFIFSSILDILLSANICVLILKLHMRHPSHSFPNTKLNVLKEVGSDTDTDANVSLY